MEKLTAFIVLSKPSAIVTENHPQELEELQVFISAASSYFELDSASKTSHKMTVVIQSSKIAPRNVKLTHTH